MDSQPLTKVRLTDVPLSHREAALVTLLGVDTGDPEDLVVACYWPSDKAYVVPRAAFERVMAA